MTVDEFASAVKMMQNNIETDLLDLLEKESLSLTKKIRERVKSKGIVASGDGSKRTSDYSEKSNWKKKRVKRGLQVDYKDLYFSGNLFDSLQPREKKKEGNVLTVMSSVTPTEKNYKIVKGLTEQEGLTDKYVTSPTKEEYDFAVNSIRESLITIIKGYGL